MPQGTTQRRNLAPPSASPPLPQPKTSMDPIPRKNPISSTTKQPHPTSKDPTFTPPASIQHISNHFAKLYTNQKFIASLKGSNRISHPHHHHPQIDTNSKVRASAGTAPLDSSCSTLTKSKSHRGRNVGDIHKDSSSRTKVKEKDKKDTKKLPQGVDFEKALAKQSWKEPKEEKVVSYEEKDLKKSAFLMSKSLELDGLKSSAEKCEIGRPSITLGMKIFRGRRKSFSCSQAELADFFSCSGVKVVAVDMPPFMQIHVVDCARKAHDSLEKFTSKSLALTLKKEFDGVYGPAWHCIVGTSFGSFVTHSVGGFMYFSMDHKLYILLFKTTVQKAD